MLKPKENIANVLRGSQWLGRGEYAVDASAPMNPLAGRVHLGLRVPLQKRRNRRTETHDWLSVKIPSVQRHQFLGSILAGWCQAESGEGARSKALRTSGAHSPGINFFVCKWWVKPWPSSQQNQGQAGPTAPGRSWGPRGGSGAPLCCAECIRTGLPSTSWPQLRSLV